MNLQEDEINIWIQGLAGIGLVGYNIAKTLQTEFNLKLWKSYGIYFPNIAPIENGKIYVNSIRIYNGKIDKNKMLWVVTGPQPDSDALSSLFIQQFIKDLEEINKKHKITMYMAFGAFVTSYLSEVIQHQKNRGGQPIEIVNRIITQEMTKERPLFVATAGNITFDMFVKETKARSFDGELRKEESGYISGLNGVLPALVGEILNIPSIACMIDTCLVDFEGPRGPTGLSLFLGFLASMKGLQFLNKMFDLRLNFEALENQIESLSATAKEQLFKLLSSSKEGRDYRGPKDVI